MDHAVQRTVAVVAALAFTLLAAWAAWPAGKAEAADTKAAPTGRDQVAEARRHLGTTYDPSRCDAFRLESQTCLNKLVYRKFGWNLPLNPRKQMRYGKTVERSNLRPGDLVYFDIVGSRAPDYVAIYSEDGHVILTDSYWGKVRETHISYLSGAGSFRVGKRLAPR